MSAVTGQTRVELEIGGMTCGSCAARIEKRLNRLDGVTATVNYATEHATVEIPEGTVPADVIAAVEAAGYTAVLPRVTQEEPEDLDAAVTDETRPLRQRLLISLVLSIPVVAMSMVPALQFGTGSGCRSR